MCFHCSVKVRHLPALTYYRIHDAACLVCTCYCSSAAIVLLWHLVFGRCNIVKLHHPAAILSVAVSHHTKRAAHTTQHAGVASRALVVSYQLVSLCNHPDIILGFQLFVSCGAACLPERIHMHAAHVVQQKDVNQWRSWVCTHQRLRLQFQYTVPAGLK
jgi:hypothetical protein